MLAGFKRASECAGVKSDPRHVLNIQARLYKDVACHRSGQLNQCSRWDSKCIYVHADQGIYFPQMHNCKHISLIILTLACKGVNCHK